VPGKKEHTIKTVFRVAGDGEKGRRAGENDDELSYENVSENVSENVIGMLYLGKL
jgi:hypothetical protein